MRFWRSHQPAVPDRITFGELLNHGLDQHPDAVAIVWCDSQVLVCRDHAVEALALQMAARMRKGSDAALVLTGAYAGSKPVRQCVHCVVDGAFRRRVAARRC